MPALARGRESAAPPFFFFFPLPPVGARVAPGVGGGGGVVLEVLDDLARIVRRVNDLGLSLVELVPLLHVRESSEQTSSAIDGVHVSEVPGRLEAAREGGGRK